MMKFLTLSTHTGCLLIVLILMSTIKLSRTASERSLPMDDMSANDDNDDAEVEEERRAYDLNKLKRFLLTSNAGERAAKREKQDFYKRELIWEYIQSMSDPDSNRLEQVKKRFKTYCNSYEDVVHSNWATCG